jgi:hypothetical protein
MHRRVGDTAVRCVSPAGFMSSMCNGPSLHTVRGSQHDDVERVVAVGDSVLSCHRRRRHIRCVWAPCVLLRPQSWSGLLASRVAGAVVPGARVMLSACVREERCHGPRS